MMTTNTAVVDLTVACVTSVKNATGMELDLTQDTLPILDHYAELVDSPRDEVVSLLAPMTGAYFGELLVRQLEDGEWVTDPDDYAEWRLRFERCSLTFNPIGVALEVLLGQDVPDWGAHLQAAPEDQLRVQKALENLLESIPDLLGDFDDGIDLFGSQSTQFHESIGFDHRQVIVGEVALFDEALGDLLGHTVDLKGLTHYVRVSAVPAPPVPFGEHDGGGSVGVHVLFREDPP